jgi:hypothetical protein
LFARAAANCKVGTTQAFSEAKARKTDLQDLVGGNGLRERRGDPQPDWPAVTDRAPLMQRLKLAHQDRLQPWVGSAAEFKKQGDELAHEAQIVAAMMEVLKEKGMEDAADAEYTAFCNQLQQAAREVSAAVRSASYEEARRAVGEMEKSCSSCHELYQG